MGSLFSCFQVGDEEPAALDNQPLNRHNCLRSFSEQLKALYISVFHGGAVQPIPYFPALPPATAHVGDDSIPVAHCSLPRPLAYDDPRCSQQQERILSRDKCSSYSRESRPLELSNREQTGAEATTRETSSQKNALKSFSDPSLELPYFFSTLDDEEVCPICLEGYTSDNPETTLQCSHDFHLACIYEWMERSEACPLCAKVMLFDETR